jgi:hypothetical protein
MTYENWPSQTHTVGCGCRSCRSGDRQIDRLASRSLSAALRHAQDRFESDFGYEAATPGGSITLPGIFKGWRGAITLGDLLGPNPPLPFTLSGRPPSNGSGRLYRVYQENKQRPLYIGMAYDASIQDRVASHFRSVVTQAGKLANTRRVGNLAALGAAQLGALKSEIAKLRALTAAAGMNATIKVQHGEVTPAAGQPMDPKLLHAFESALQVLERPHSYVGSARTFEADLRL